MEHVRGQHTIVWGIKWSDARNNENKIHSGLNQPLLGEPTHNNQPKIRGKMEELLKRWCNQGEACRGADSIA